MRKALAVSSDVYFYIIGGGYEGQRGLGIDRLNHWFRYFGFGEPVGILLPGEVPGVVPGREWKEETFGESWLLGNTYHTAIGQYGFTATLLQALRAVAALGNGGTLLTPTFLKSNETPVSGSLELDRQALQVIREGMRKAVEPGGTAQGLAMPYLHIAAKTGTAEVGATKSLVNSWTIGFFPEENPQYAFALVMEKGPRENLFGAVSVFRTSLDTLYRDHRDMFQNGSLVTH
jgi:penicillin-binding protein 2